MDAKKFLEENKSLLEDFNKLPEGEKAKVLKELGKKKKDPPPPRANESQADDNGF